MDIFIKASQFILSLSLLIVLHELGHFIPAKLFKTRVEKFYLFFDYKFSLLKKKIGETTYGIGWIPLGGYVKIAGMIDESMDKEQMKKPAQPWEFRSKPAWQRLIIMLGGVIVNFILGVLIYIGITFIWGRDYVTTDGVKNGFHVHESFQKYGFQNGDKIVSINGKTPENVMNINKNLFLRDVSTVEVLHSNGKNETINLPKDIGKIMWQNGIMDPFQARVPAVFDSIIKDSPAAKSGLKKGDIVTAVNGAHTSFWHEFTEKVKKAKGDLSLTIRRDGVVKTLHITPENKKIGAAPYTDNVVTVQHKDYSFGESIVKGAMLGKQTLTDYISQFKYVFTKKGASSLGGFISIGKIFPSSWDWQSFWGITAFLSIMLGFMNLLPIPALDGGHVLFTLYEMVSGRKPGEKFLEYAQITGFVILLALLLFANGNDIVKLFS